MNVGFNLEIEPDANDTLLITCPSIPGVVTFAESEADVARWSIDAILTLLQSLMNDGLTVPAGDAPAKDTTFVRLGVLASLKIELYTACRKAGVSRAELARRLGWHREQVDRLFRLHHASRLDQLEAAARAIGQEIALDVRPAARAA
jgi:antitoxin HicB